MALYPPIVASSMPAFNVATNTVRIYYTLSTYNVVRKDDIQTVQVSIRNQSSNVNVINTSLHPSEILEKPFGQQQQIDKALNRYYIDIDGTEILESISNKKKTGFVADRIYKVQLRFSSVINTGAADFYTNNINNFSEWSTVCIIKPVVAPTFYIDDFYTGKPPQQEDINYYFYNLADFVGVYKQGKSSQTLQTWRLRLLDQSYTEENILSIDDFTISDSGIILNQAENYNVEDDGSTILACSLPYQLTNEKKYKLLFQIQTKNGYTDSVLYSFTSDQIGINTLRGKLNTYINEEEGYIKIEFDSDEIQMMNIVLRRSDSKSNFLKWEDLKFIEVLENASFTYYDFTAQSGLFYRYLVQRIDARGRRGTPVYDQTRGYGSGTMAEWQHAFLLESTGNGEISGTKQLKLKYDFQISSYKTNISESKTDTIGSKYPFIRRNGNMYYRSFPITGTITQFMDEANLLTNSNTLFDGKYDKYKEFKGQIGNYTTLYDYTYERKFREKVEQFLYNAKPKLYKSMQEGNIFIKLMQVSLTPKNELGRLIYSFSATAYEIDDAVLNTYNNYGIIDIGTFNPNLSQTKTILGQISSYGFNDNITDSPFKAGQDIIGAGSTPAANSIANFIKYNQTINNKIVTDFTINWFRLTIESDPYLIIESSPGVFRPYDDIDSDGSDFIDFTNPIDYQLYQMESTYNGINIYLGWLFTINGKQIIIAPPNNIYELKEETFSFKKNVQIIPAKDTAMLVDFRLIEVRSEDISMTPKNIRAEKVNGQLIGTYSRNAELISRIYYKYKYTYYEGEGDTLTGKNRVQRAVNGVKTVLVDTQPGAIIYIRTSEMNQENRFVVNANGQLNFDPLDNEINIISLRIAGMNISIDDTVDKGVVSNLSSVQYPIEGDICTINNILYCYYNGQWYQASKTQNNKFIDIDCPVDALIFYSATIEEDIYQ